MSWTDERIDRLKAMWTKGATASQIAEELGGVSRNAVIGKAHRLGLESRPSPVKPGEEKEKKAKPAPKAKVEAPKAAPVKAAPAAPASDPIPRIAPADAPRRPAVIPGSSAVAMTPAKADSTNVQYRSVGPGGFIRQGPGDTQAPIPPAPPRRLVPAKPSAEVADKTSLLELNDRICRWPMGTPANRTSTSAGTTPTRAIPIASIIAVSPIRRSFRDAIAARRRPCHSAARAYVEK
ncbi:GcrA family cell cycle regulator [Sphingomonas rhizophila]|uniref:GcrA family cell cycle regulator n=1 Tax=Sphingomonas rhizophila TaxID=2071607 RepID=UPI003CCDCA0E